MKVFVTTLALLLSLGFVSVPVAQAACLHGKGQVGQVEWKGKWYKARIQKVRVTANGTCQYYITYPGWSHSWDEWVTTRRMRRF